MRSSYRLNSKNGTTEKTVNGVFNVHSFLRSKQHLVNYGLYKNRESVFDSANKNNLQPFLTL